MENLVTDFASMRQKRLPNVGTVNIPKYSAELFLMIQPIRVTFADRAGHPCNTSGK